MQQDQIEQSGARSGKSPSIVDDQWSFLGSPTCVDGNPIKEVLKDLSSVICPYTWLQTPVADVVQLFKSMAGYVGGSLSNTNPFIRSADEISVPVEDFLVTQQTLKDGGRLEVERLLREVLIAQFDPVRSTVALLSLLNVELLTKVKRTIIVCLENEIDCKSWNSWKEYAGSRPDTYSEVRKRRAKEDFDKFWRVADKMLSQIVLSLKESVTEDETPTEDVEKILRRWRDIPGYYRDASSWQEIIDRERVIFDMLLPKIEITWEARGKHLNKLLSRDEMGLTSSVIDARVIELAEATSYYEWLKNAQQVLKLATVKGLSFKGAAERKKIPQPPMKQRELPPPQVRERNSFIKDETHRPSQVWCSHCKRAGHSFNECRTRTQLQAPRVPNSCFLCGEAGHWAPQCPKRGQRIMEQPSVTQAPIPKSSPALLPSSTMPPVSRYGRTYRPAQPRTLHTLNTEIEHEVVTNNCRDNDDIPQSDSEVDVLLPLLPISHHIVADKVDQLTSLHTYQKDVVMPTVKVIIDSTLSSDDLNLSGLIDTGSNISYISRPTYEKLRKLLGADIKDPDSTTLLAIETMTGVKHQHVKRVQLTIAIEDSSSSRSAFKSSSLIIYDGDQIPGGYDFLLDADWVITQRLNIRGIDSGFEILLPKPAFTDAATMTGSDAIVLNSIELDPPEIEDCDDHFVETMDELAKIMSELPAKSIAMGPLSESELKLIKSAVHDPPVTLTVRQDKLDPPAIVFGYPAPRQRQEKLIELLDSLEAQGVLKKVAKGSSCYISPGFAARKPGPGDRIRLLVNLSSVNARLEPPPAGVRYHDTSTWINGLPSWATFYSSLDVKDAYFRIPVAPESRKYLHMSIWTPNGTIEYEWLKMPQGLSISPSYWCSLIESIVQSLISFMESSDNPLFHELLQATRVQTYFDDVLIAAKSKEACEAMTSLVFQVLSFNGMYLPESKIQRCAEKVQIMGFVLCKGQLLFNDETLQKISNLKRPTSKQELRSALGLLNYVRRSLGSNSDKLGCLYSLVQDKSRFHWGTEHESAWKILVDDFRGGIPLCSFSLCPGVEDYSKWSVVIQTDASDIAAGFCVYLIPRVDDGSEIDLHRIESKRLINVGVRHFRGPEKTYAAHDREALAIFWALCKNRTLIYLIGEAILQTDNKTSISRFKQLHPDDTSTTRGRRWARWISDLSDLLFSRSSKGGRNSLVRFAHVSGDKNCFADYLSRFVMADLHICDSASQTEQDYDSANSDSRPLVLTTSGTTPSPGITHPSMNDTITSLLSKWDADDESCYIKRVKLRHIYNFLKGISIDGTESTRRIVKEVCERRFSLEGDFLLFHNNNTPVIVVPNIKMIDGVSLRTYFIKYVHEDSPLSAHRAELGTRSQLRRTFWWPSMDDDVRLWILSCAACVLRKRTSPNGTYNPRKLQFPNQLLYVDWAGPFQASPSGFQYVLLLVDGFSSFAVAFAYRNKSSENVVDGLFNYISLFGMIDSWTSDNDVTFISETCRLIRSMIGIKDLTVPTYSPSTQGSVERAVRTLKEGIETIILSQADDNAPIDWVTLIRASTFSSNSLPRFGNLSPFEVMLGRTPADPLLSNFGVVKDRSDSVDHNEYVSKMKTHLNEIQTYWSSKMMEVRNISADRDCNGLGEILNKNDLCARVCYISGRRHCFGKFIVLDRLKNNLYSILHCDSGKIENAHGYQLLKIQHHPDRPTFRLTPDSDSNDYFIIERVLSYDPHSGYEVKWIGFDEPTFQRPADMPTAFRRQMAAARDRYRRSHLGGVW